MSRKKIVRKARKILEIEIEKSPDYQLTYATGVFGNVGPNDGQLTFFVDRVEPTMGTQPGEMRVKTIKRRLLIEVHMSPNQFKEIAKWMTKKVYDLEKYLGRIPSVPLEEESEGT